MGQQTTHDSAIPEVAVFFEDPKINLLFSDLLKARGVATRIINCAENLTCAAKIISDPQYFHLLRGWQPQNCLIIGNKEVVKGLNAITLSRPLTETKIELAIAELMKGGESSA
jgi:hypothetical protein